MRRLTHEGTLLEYDYRTLAWAPMPVLDETTWPAVAARVAEYLPQTGGGHE